MGSRANGKKSVMDEKQARGDWVKTCSILTTTPNALTSAVHDRMPVILDADGYTCGWIRGCAMSARRPNC